jgi:hypothetical protein
MIKREDLAQVEDAAVVEGVDNFEQEIDSLLSNTEVLRYKSFKLLFIVYDPSSIVNTKRVLKKSDRAEIDKIFYIDMSSAPSSAELREKISACEEMIINAGYDVKKEHTFLSDCAGSVWTVSWK